MLRLSHADHFALADFFRQSRWCPVAVRQAVLKAQMAVLQRLMRLSALARVPLFLSLDDSLAVKDVATRALQAVAFHHDHVRQRRQSGRYTNTARYLTLTAHLHGFSFPPTWRAYRRSLAATPRPAQTLVSRCDRRAAAHVSGTPDRVRSRPGASGVEQPVAGSFVPRVGRASLFLVSRRSSKALAESWASRLYFQPNQSCAVSKFANVQLSTVIQGAIDKRTAIASPP